MSEASRQKVPGARYNSEEAEEGQPTFESTRVIPPAIWTRHRDEIRRYKLVEKKPLAQIMALMETKHGLKATYVRPQARSAVPAMYSMY